MSVFVPYAVSEPAVELTTVASPFATPAGRARIERGGWALPVAAIDVARPTDAAGIGALAVRVRTALSIGWRGLKDGPAQPALTVDRAVARSRARDRRSGGRYPGEAASPPVAGVASSRPIRHRPSLRHAAAPDLPRRGRWLGSGHGPRGRGRAARSAGGCRGHAAAGSHPRLAARPVLHRPTPAGVPVRRGHSCRRGDARGGDDPAAGHARAGDSQRALHDDTGEQPAAVRRVARRRDGGAGDADDRHGPVCPAADAARSVRRQRGADRPRSHAAGGERFPDHPAAGRERDMAEGGGRRPARRRPTGFAFAPWPARTCGPCRPGPRPMFAVVATHAPEGIVRGHQPVAPAWDACSRRSRASSSRCSTCRRNADQMGVSFAYFDPATASGDHQRAPFDQVYGGGRRRRRPTRSRFATSTCRRRAVSCGRSPCRR